MSGKQKSFTPYLEDVKKQTEHIISKTVGNSKYNSSSVQTWVDSITHDCISHLRNLNDDFKYVVSVIIMEKKLGGFHLFSTCYWDCDQDGTVTARLIADKVVHYLCEILIDTQELIGEQYANRLTQLKRLLRPEEFDEVAINRASMGWCGWIGCPNPPPETRCMELLYMIWKSKIDSDVIDSFDSLNCFEKFMEVRSLLDPTLTQLRTIPEDLAEDYIANKLPQSNLEQVLNKLGVEAANTVRAQAPGSNGVESSIAERTEPATREARKGAVEKAAEIAAERKAVTHDRKQTDTVSTSDDWKLIPKASAVRMAEMSYNDILKFEYQSSDNESNDPAEASGDNSGEREFFKSLDELLGSTFDSDDEDTST